MMRSIREQNTLQTLSLSFKNVSFLKFLTNCIGKSENLEKSEFWVVFCEKLALRPSVILLGLPASTLQGSFFLTWEMKGWTGHVSQRLPLGVLKTWPNTGQVNHNLGGWAWEPIFHTMPT